MLTAKALSGQGARACLFLSFLLLFPAAVLAASDMAAKCSMFFSLMIFSRGSDMASTRMDVRASVWTCHLSHAVAAKCGLSRVVQLPRLAFLNVPKQLDVSR